MGKALRKVSDTAGQIWNKTVGKDGLGKALGWVGGKLTGQSTDEFRQQFRELFPDWMHDIKAADWQMAAMMLLGPAALSSMGGSMASWGLKGITNLGKVGELMKGLNTGQKIMKGIGMGAHALAAVPAMGAGASMWTAALPATLAFGGTALPSNIASTGIGTGIQTGIVPGLGNMMSGGTYNQSAAAANAQMYSPTTHQAGIPQTSTQTGLQKIGQSISDNVNTIFSRDVGKLANMSPLRAGVNVASRIGGTALGTNYNPYYWAQGYGPMTDEQTLREGTLNYGDGKLSPFARMGVDAYGAAGGGEGMTSDPVPGSGDMFFQGDAPGPDAAYEAGLDIVSESSDLANQFEALEESGIAAGENIFAEYQDKFAETQDQLEGYQMTPYGPQIDMGDIEKLGSKSSKDIYNFAQTQSMGAMNQYNASLASLKSAWKDLYGAWGDMPSQTSNFMDYQGLYPQEPSWG